MLENFKAWYKDKSENGINFFYANDKSTGKPSSTLFYAYLAFWLSFISVIALHFSDRFLTATSMSFVFTGMMIIFYMIREINKASFNLKDRSISLENDGKKSDDKNT